MAQRTASAAALPSGALDLSLLPDTGLSEVAKEFKKALRPFVARRRAGKAVDVVALAQILVHCVVEEARTAARTPEAEALLRGLEAREQVKNREGGHLSANDVGSILGLSKAAVLERFRKGQLLGWRAAQEAVRFPVWQFRDGGVLLGLNEILEVWKTAPHLDDWAKILFFLSPLESLKKDSPLTLLRRGEVKKVVELARAYGE